MTPDHEVLVIGAGIGGIGVGIALREAGITDFKIVDRADGVGGVWHANRYPGVAVDIPAMAYQFSFDPNPGWSRVFAPGAEVRAYLRGMVDRYGLQPHIELRTSVSSRTWDEQEHVWRVVLNGTREITTRYVVSAIGVFPEPKPAQIDGIGEFRGKIMHSTTWDENYDIAGKRVAVVGTGASALQIVPAIASQVAHLDVYQRTPIWVLKKFDPDIPPWMKDLFTRVPLATRLGNRIVTALSELFTIKLPVHHAKAPWFAHRIERAARDHLERSVCDPVLRRQLTPDYGFACKRPSFSNTYLAAFERDNVDLVTDTIEQITPEGIRTVDGKDRPVDAIVLATGFHMAFSPEVYRRSPVVGRNGFNLADYFERERYQAYESITMPGLPNHFMIYGPYGGTGGAYHVMVENGGRHIVRVIQEARRRGATAVEVTREATERYHRVVASKMTTSLWFTNNCAAANSYYFDQHGDVTAIRPTSGRQSKRASRTFPLNDYRFETKTSVTAFVPALNSELRSAKASTS
ncbi:MULTISPECIES: flavin-containing monooxygenase [Mycobacterium]|uniref:Monooxygenase n=1 Tax=Mycobacterium kiyosense TaxID=2871094 RepID=A0A9P3Q564_9MYCO|nr:MULTISPECIES: NAD(P)/FAD-dependent oxidoreductase [Mycobacterium]BDB44845.1 putative monooxygenase [Mycobacterium kiyosense]BDE16331.1 putative monooxygenase [Mycobacterium sp. 20KCMC460]GLB82807.1 putative monooxygenase [Mycobacterium kiyosense]GLB89454.1 putative monooxygenase [Mycobacterium kiyosense]GLB94952.1 putative monooxygenase [Mycobacterium kiyosense]